MGIDRKRIKNILIKIVIFIILLFVFSKWSSIEKFIKDFFKIIGSQVME